MGIRLTLVYAGGEKESIPIKPTGLVAAERKFGAGSTNGHAIESTLYAAWHVKGCPAASFDAWLETIDEVVDSEEVPPLPLGQEPSPKLLQT